MEPGSYDHYPWEIEPYSELRQGRWQLFESNFKTIERGSVWERGDIIKINYAFWSLGPQRELIIDFFNRMSIRKEIIPIYASEEYAIILTRYKWTKQKDLTKYIDYGTMVMMLTGSKIGKVKRFFARSPFKLVSKYPYKIKLPKEITYVKKSLKEATSNTRTIETLSIDTRNKYLKILYDRLNQKECV